jgi:hypothetical protein
MRCSIITSPEPFLSKHLLSITAVLPIYNCRFCPKNPKDREDISDLSLAVQIPMLHSELGSSKLASFLQYKNLPLTPQLEKCLFFHTHTHTRIIHIRKLSIKLLKFTQFSDDSHGVFPNYHSVFAHLFPAVEEKERTV